MCNSFTSQKFFQYLTPYDEGEDQEAEPIHVSSSEPPKKKKRKRNMISATFDMMKTCTSALQQLRRDDLDEFEATGINVAKKLQRMDSTQAIHAESLINTVLKRSLLKTLTAQTDFCDNNRCNVRLLAAHCHASAPFPPSPSSPTESHTLVPDKDVILSLQYNASVIIM